MALSLENYNLESVFLNQEIKLKSFIKNLQDNSPFYKKKLKDAGIELGDIKTIEDLNNVPFTTKDELRQSYPLGLMAVPEEKIVRIHSSSGTTGKPVIVPYTKNDVDNWAEMFSRCYEMAGVTKKDRVQVTPGYGLWTAGIGFQAGVERLGAMTVPTGPGNTEKQLEMLVDMQSTVLCATSSYALLLAEEVCKRDLKDKINLKIGVFGSERWGEKMRHKIEEYLGIKTYDIYGLTEIYGPGIAIDCSYHQGLHFWSDHLLFEIVDPETGKQLPVGEQGELVITTLSKEGMPLLRYRTRDITRIIPQTCPCGSEYPMIERILGRTDDMLKVKGVNIYPGQIDHVLKITEGCGSEYQIHVNKINGKDHLLIKTEGKGQDLKNTLHRNIKTKIGIRVEVEVLPYGSLPRSEKKSKRVFDKRNV